MVAFWLAHDEAMRVAASSNVMEVKRRWMFDLVIAQNPVLVKLKSVLRTYVFHTTGIQQVVCCVCSYIFVLDVTEEMVRVGGIDIAGVGGIKKS